MHLLLLCASNRAPTSTSHQKDVSTLRSKEEYWDLLDIVCCYVSCASYLVHHYPVYLDRNSLHYGYTRSVYYARPLVPCASNLVLYNPLFFV